MLNLNDALNAIFANAIEAGELRVVNQGYWLVLEKKPDGNLGFFFLDPMHSYFTELPKAQTTADTLKAAGYNAVLAAVSAQVGFKVL